MRSLESYRGKDFIGADELSKAAAALVERYRGEPERGNVRLTITQRIVRHYLAEDLLGEPSGQSGAATVFNYGNLLRLLAVKKLLSDNWSVARIREFMRTLDITALEQLINSAFSRSTNPNQTRNPRVAQRRGRDEAKPESPLEVTPSRNSQVRPARLVAIGMASTRRIEARSSEWIEIATGLELKVRRSFRPPRTEQERELLVARFWAVVGKKKIE